MPFPFCCGHLPFHPLPFLPLEGPLQLHQQVVEVEEGGHSVGGWKELWLSGSLLQLGAREAGFVENLYTWCGREGLGIDKGDC